MVKLPVKYFLSCIFLMMGIKVNGQKLPQVQLACVRAPANIKIDGRAAEWDDKFQAYNNHVEFFYTISNDDNNLYLTVRVPDKQVIRRVLNGGITLIVNRAGKKNDKNDPSVTYPLFENSNRFAPRFGESINTANLHGQNTISNEERAAMVIVGGRVGVPLTFKQADSIMKVNNSLFLSKATNIGIRGITDIDSLISIYNTDGIKTAASFDTKATYTYEMAFPLKYLPGETNSGKIRYHLLINSVVPPFVPMNDANVPGIRKSASPKPVVNGPPAQPATDFWGEYTLAKK